MRVPPALVPSALGFAVFAYFCVRYQAPRVERDIAERASNALRRLNPETTRDHVQVTGRDVTLRGVRGSFAVSEEARSAVAQVWGVRQPVHFAITEPVVTPVAKPSPFGGDRRVAPAAPAPVQYSADEQKLDSELQQYLKGRSIRFQPASDTLLRDGQGLLDGVAAVLRRYPELPVDIRAHTDGDGDEAQNLRLSEKRAAAVKQYLIRRGVKSEMLSATGYGESQPVVSPERTQADKARNRRIELHPRGTPRP